MGTNALPSIRRPPLTLRNIGCSRLSLFHCSYLLILFFFLSSHLSFSHPGQRDLKARHGELEDEQAVNLEVTAGPDGQAEVVADEGLELDVGVGVLGPRCHRDDDGRDSFRKVSGSWGLGGDGGLEARPPTRGQPQPRGADGRSLEARPPTRGQLWPVGVGGHGRSARARGPIGTTPLMCDWVMIVCFFDCGIV